MEASPQSPIQATEAGHSRPTLITVLCVLGFIGGLITVPMIFTDTSRSMGAWYPPYLALCAVVGFVCMVGLWKMRRWAVFTYSGLVAVNQIVMFAMGIWTIFALVIPGIFIALMFSQVSKMR